jgi:hypothetical protein
LINRQANAADPLPISYIKLILSLEQSQIAVNENAAVKKKMNATNAKALNTMKQKLKKTIRENEAIIEKYKAVSPFLCHFLSDHVPRLHFHTSQSDPFFSHSTLCFPVFSITMIRTQKLLSRKQLQ